MRVLVLCADIRPFRTKSRTYKSTDDQGRVCVALGGTDTLYVGALENVTAVKAVRIRSRSRSAVSVGSQG